MDLMTGLAREQGSTVVIVTHDARVAAYADRIVMVRDGLLTTADLPVSPAGEPYGAPAPYGSPAPATAKGLS
jgi:energy-coupling factor transporter ATP-binding protein EcfA2